MKKYKIHYDSGNVTELGKPCQYKQELSKVFPFIPLLLPPSIRRAEEEWEEDGDGVFYHNCDWIKMITPSSALLLLFEPAN